MFGIELCGWWFQGTVTCIAPVVSRKLPIVPNWPPQRQVFLSRHQLSLIFGHSGRSASESMVLCRCLHVAARCDVDTRNQPRGPTAKECVDDGTLRKQTQKRNMPIHAKLFHLCDRHSQQYVVESISKPTGAPRHVMQHASNHSKGPNDAASPQSTTPLLHFRLSIWIQDFYPATSCTSCITVAMLGLPSELIKADADSRLLWPSISHRIDDPARLRLRLPSPPSTTQDAQAFSNHP